MTAPVVETDALITMTIEVVFAPPSRRTGMLIPRKYIDRSGWVDL